ncbi:MULTISPECIES: biotin--[acetyl-CoA-carboxylase] ligase [unclassified Streptococcus]|uniref:biotin--[acetyl-CoA-carboxylase] ligase n=1 Tax=unclassified Streptococcus TaxID=2608887 RepID=UPI0011B3A9E4|nr:MULTISPECIES: biotin--[acetyl-CoA-carboxylase] ligase [unclassified Streptococcus]TWS95633.1 biotin--[acetyl-CoA-carboxylase] ligase [Streptococcus sp. sy018]TWT16751.1 biotin--[acetyl-CoA-carboxylase] ligase [Streptococcus sp. sy010]
MKTDYLSAKEISQATGLQVSVNSNSQSTQLDAKLNLKSAEQLPVLYLAPQQEQAVGRFGRPFYTNQGGIYMTLHLKPNCSYDDLPVYTMMTATSIVKAIQRLTGIDCGIKWVNDIYYQGKKIAGILTESLSSEQDVVTDLLIGVGINFFISEFPSELNQIAHSLFQETPPISRNQLISEIWQIFFNTPKRDLIRVYRDKSLVLDKKISFTDKGKSYEGLVIDISQKGELVVQLTDNSQKRLSSHHISLSSWEM